MLCGRFSLPNAISDICFSGSCGLYAAQTEGKNQAVVGTIPFCGEYPGPRFEDKFRSANQVDGISKADGDKMAAS